MRKLKLFLDNFLVYGLGGIISKLIPLIMVPLITAIMPNPEYYGISDLSNTIVQFGTYIAIMGMYDAMYRLFFEKEDATYKRIVCSTTLFFTILSALVIAVITILFRNVIAKYFFGNQQYFYIIYLDAIAIFVTATNNIISAPTRMQNQRKVYLVANAIAPILSYSLAIPLLLAGYYIIALPIAAIMSGILVELTFVILNHEWFSIKSFDTKVLKQLLPIAIPLLPNFVIYWIFNSCDKVMISNILGVGAAGIYSVGSKLGHTSQLIYMGFSGGWQFFAFSTMKEDNQVQTNSKVFEYLGVISFISTAFICACSRTLFGLLFKIDYLNGFIVAPYLFISPLLQMLFQVASNQFIVVKKTWPNFIILLAGAVLNIIINFLLIPKLGIEGAAIATLSGYIISDVICCIVLVKMKLMTIEKRFIKSCIVMFIFFIIWRTLASENIKTGILLVNIVILIYLILYRVEVTKVFSKLLRIGAKK